MQISQLSRLFILQYSVSCIRLLCSSEFVGLYIVLCVVLYRCSNSTFINTKWYIYIYRQYGTFLGRIVFIIIEVYIFLKISKDVWCRVMKLRLMRSLIKNENSLYFNVNNCPGGCYTRKSFPLKHRILKIWSFLVTIRIVAKQDIFHFNKK